MKKWDFGQFGDEKKKMFELMWTAFRLTFGRKSAGYEQLKLCNRLGEKLEAISKPMPVKEIPLCETCGRPSSPSDDTARELVRVALLLDAMEHEKLLSMLKDDQLGWTFAAGKSIEKLVEAGLEAPDVDVVEKKKK